MAIDTSAWNEPQLDPLTPPPEDFDGLMVGDAVVLIKGWFFTNFEDPADHTPYDSSEGGYQYIWGGPYDTDDIIRNVFADVASDAIINAAISAIQNDGFEWAPNEQRIQPPDDDWSIPDDPHGIFMESYHHTGTILAAYGSEDGGDLINRMVFAQQVSALEAYLSDTLIKAISENENAIKRLVIKDKYLKAEKYPLADIITAPDFVAEKVRAYLRSFGYHNLARVDFLYRTALS